VLADSTSNVRYAFGCNVVAQPPSHAAASATTILETMVMVC
jgi:hypothetical protein